MMNNLKRTLVKRRKGNLEELKEDNRRKSRGDIGLSSYMILDRKHLILFVGIVCLPQLLVTLVKHVRNRAFMRRIKVLEELMDSTLRCAFSIVSPTVEIRGRYRGRSVRFSSYLSGSVVTGRVGEFMLTCSKLPKQKKLMLSYPHVSENVHQVGNKLIYSNCDDFVWQKAVLGKARAIQILDELVDAAEECEGKA